RQQRLLVELDDAAAVQFDLAEAARRPHGRDGAGLAVAEVELDQAADVEVADAVAVGEQEVAALEVAAGALDAGAGHGGEAGLGEGDVPVLDDAGVVDGEGLGGAEVEADVGVQAGVVEEVLLDDPALVAHAEDEVVKAVAGVALHDVPEDGPAADGDHR